MCTINRVFKELGSQALPMPNRNRTLILAPFLPEMTKSSGQKTVFGLCFTPPQCQHLSSYSGCHMTPSFVVMLVSVLFFIQSKTLSSMQGDKTSNSSYRGH